MSVRSWVEIDEKRLAENFAQVREAAGAGTDVLAVVKANAYGHGLERCAVALTRMGGLDHKGPARLGVADAAEGVRARRALDAAGIGRDAVEILVMCGVFRDEAITIAEHGLTPVVWTVEQVGWLREATQASWTGVTTNWSPMRVHVEIETGMGRQGAQPGEDLTRVLVGLLTCGLLELDGVCAHFSSAEVAGSERTREQKIWFDKAVSQIRQTVAMFRQDPSMTHVRLPRWVHAGSSSSVDVGDTTEWLNDVAQSVGARAMVRSGIALYGYALPVEGAESKIRAKLKPVMTWKTRVLDVREVAAGETIGYNATFTVKRPMRVALLPVGYADGLRRELSGTDDRAGGWVMVRGAGGAMRRAAIVGRVSMNLTTVDVTGMDGVSVGDEVVLLGDGVTADDHARIAGTIAYEILCGVKAS